MDYLLLCGGAVAFVGGIVHGYVACGDDEVAVGGYFVEELIVFPRRVGACSVAPYEHREGIVLGEGREILWHEDSVSLEVGYLCHDAFVGTFASVFDDA